MRTFGLPDVLFIIEAARWTIALSLVAFIGGAIGGLVVALARVADAAPVRLVATAFVRLFQGTPLLLQLFLVFFGAPVLGWDLNPWIAASVALILNTSAFLGEIWRGCIEAIPRTQWEAADSLALSRIQRLRYVILPQAMRIALGPTVGFMMQIVKNTSVTALIGFVELTRSGQLLNNMTFQPFQVFLTVAVIYFVVCFPMSWWSEKLEGKRRARPTH